MLPTVRTFPRARRRGRIFAGDPGSAMRRGLADRVRLERLQGSRCRSLHQGRQPASFAHHASRFFAALTGLTLAVASPTHRALAESLGCLRSGDLSARVEVQPGMSGGRGSFIAWPPGWKARGFLLRSNEELQSSTRRWLDAASSRRCSSRDETTGVLAVDSPGKSPCATPHPIAPALPAAATSRARPSRAPGWRRPRLTRGAEGAPLPYPAARLPSEEGERRPRSLCGRWRCRARSGSRHRGHDHERALAEARAWSEVGGGCARDQEPLTPIRLAA